MAHTWIIREEAELAPIAHTVLSSLSHVGQGAKVLALKGDLGAGKTALTKAIARELGITEHVTSPTFVIMKSYPIVGKEGLTTLTHIDAYRIDEDEELRVLGFEELLTDPTRLIVIEWPERVLGLLPSSTETVSIMIGQSGERIITYGN